MHVRKALRRWGNAYGNLISKSKAELLGAGVGALIEIELRPSNSLPWMPTMDAGRFDWRQTLDDALRKDRHGGD